MTLLEQLKNIFDELFEVSGFEEKQKKEMTEEMIHIWLTKSLMGIFELLTKEEKVQFTEISSIIEKDKHNIQSKKDALQLLSNLDNGRYGLAIDILYFEAGNIIERMIKKFSLKSTPQQNEIFMNKVSLILNKN